MAERNPQSGFAIRKTLFVWFAMAIILVVASMLYIGSTGRPRFIDRNLLPSEKALSVYEIATSHFKNTTQFQSNNCNPEDAILKLYMYDLPPEFHFGLLDWKPEGDSVWPNLHRKIPNYPGGLNLQHSIEYWLTLDLLSSTDPTRPNPCTAVRVTDPNQADLIFVPFFSSVSYNRYSKVIPPEKISLNKKLQQNLVKYLTSREEYKRSNGRDHVILAHHPNSMLDARSVLFPCVFILSDFGRYNPNVANLEKDIIAPYRHLAKTNINDSAGFDDQPTFLYFRGAIYRKEGGNIRQELYYLLRNEKDVEFGFGSIQANGINKASQGMHGSKFCLNIAGDTPSSNRLFDAIVSHCVPVIISDDIELPFEDFLDYSEFCIFVRAADAIKEGYLMGLLKGVGKERWTAMWERLKEVDRYFEYRYPSVRDDAVQMIWKALARKVPAIRLKVNRLRRYQRFGRGLKESADDGNFPIISGF
ncbi:Exostosin family protein [Rhynchospora pubera]|uniref:Exostosin family protein n=1 Tax=Rhynchospora pubera TaxID=906938 RepID=A0AAV8AU39_9POAL|nr:Exostosin family protein [Rhynchospora pubera]KAJ4807352.1 Exostosin family protein [Rhynchospora pubera]